VGHERYEMGNFTKFDVGQTTLPDLPRLSQERDSRIAANYAKKQLLATGLTFK
jgi:hypothetical protein